MTKAHGKSPRHGRPCLWPIGDPALPDFRFCGAPRSLDRPYCAEHADLAYQKASKRTARTAPRALGPGPRQAR